MEAASRDQALQGIQAAFLLGDQRSGCEDRLPGEGWFPAMAPDRGIMSCYQWIDHLQTVDSSKGMRARHQSSRHEAVSCGSEGG